MSAAAPSSASPSPSSVTVSPRPAHDAPTEGLRGFAALMVLFTHMLTPMPHVDPGYAASPFFWRIEASQGAVLLFFVLSGYVIGMTNPAHFSAAAVRSYAFRRALRLLPLYILAVAATVLVRPLSSLGTVIGNLLFLQNDLPYGRWQILPLPGNTNLWSLNYEVLYYALFPLVWFTSRHWRFWLAAAALTGAFAWKLPHAGLLVATYAAGWTFWLAGYGLAQAPRVDPDAPAQRLPWPSLLLLWFALWHLKPLWWFAHRFEFAPEGAWMNWAFYDFILPSVGLLMACSGRRPRATRAIAWSTLGLALAFVAWRVVRGRELGLDDALCVLALAAWGWRPSVAPFRWLAPVGAISYALYIFHTPVQEFMIRQTWLPSGSALTFMLRCALILALAAAVAWAAERRLQPWIRRRLTRPAAPLLSPAAP